MFQRVFYLLHVFQNFLNDGFLSVSNTINLQFLSSVQEALKIIRTDINLTKVDKLKDLFEDVALDTFEEKERVLMFHGLAKDVAEEGAGAARLLPLLAQPTHQAQKRSL